MAPNTVLMILALCGAVMCQRRASDNLNQGFGLQRIPAPTPGLPPPVAPPVQARPLVKSPSAPPRSSAPGPIVELLRSNMDGPNEDGSYSFEFETSDGLKREEQGVQEGATLVVRGSYSYTAPDGTLVEVKYIADEKGFRAESPHIPAIPQHSLDQIKAAEDARLAKPTLPTVVQRVRAPPRNV